MKVELQTKENLVETSHKNVIVIGNGPSGLSLSYMLSGNIPYVISDTHPDEMLSLRLQPFLGESLVNQNLRLLAEGLEGRSTNLISLLLDALVQPYADMGLELPPLVEWKPNGKKFDHLVLGKGPPGGAWHFMDPQILTLSLGSWMSLPGYPHKSRDGSEKRAYAGNVAKYYEDYVQKTNIGNNFESNVIVTKVKPLRNVENDEKMECCTTDDECVNRNKCEQQQCQWLKKIKEESPEKRKFCFALESPDTCRRMKLCPLSSALDLISCGKKKKRDRCYLNCNMRNSSNKTQKSSSTCNLLRDERIIDSEIYNRNSGRNRNSSLSEVHNFNTNRNRNNSLSEAFNSQNPSELRVINNKNSFSYDSLPSKVPYCPNSMEIKDEEPLWLVEIYDKNEHKIKAYTCNNLVIAVGASDIPNKLNLSNQKQDPDWFMYGVRNLEVALDVSFKGNFENINPDPVLVVGAGLSAADAIIAARGRNIPVIHVFKSESVGLNKQLPENMYPEYHKVHQMMVDGGSSYPLYKALPGYVLTNFDDDKKTVELTSSGEKKTEIFNVSFAAILIGSRPDLSFLPDDFKLGVNKNLPIDCKMNPIDVDQMTYAVNGYKGIYVMGPLVGDNFVRFIPGGALAILSDLYKKYNC